MQVLAEPWMDIVAAIAVSILLSFLAYRFDLLTKSGCVAALTIGSAIGIFGSLMWLLLLIVFTVLGFAATLIGFSKKKEKGLQEGTHGERTYRNVLGVALPCVVFAVLNLITSDEYYYQMTIGYISTIAVAAADTAASEIGTKDENVYLITTFRRVTPGTDGGISLLGTGICIVATVAVTLIGWGFINGTVSDIQIILPMIAGVIGCMLDSLIGATLETEGYVSKYANNCITGIAGGLIAVMMSFAFF